MTEIQKLTMKGYGTKADATQAAKQLRKLDLKVEVSKPQGRRFWRVRVIEQSYITEGY